jgi:hypothetical protein
MTKSTLRGALCSVFFTNYYSGKRIKKTEMGGACSTYDDKDKCIYGFGGATRGKKAP